MDNLDKLYKEAFESAERLEREFPDPAERLLIMLARYEVAAEGKSWPPVPDCMWKIYEMLKAAY